MRLFRVASWLVASLMIVSFAPSAIAQENQIYETGLNPYQTYQGGNIDSIDLFNRGLNVDIPLISYPQRGGILHLDFDLHYINQGNWYNCTPGTNCSSFYGTGLTNGFGVILKNWPSIWGTTCQALGDQYGTWTCQGSATMSDGSTHSMLPITVNSWESEDTSGFQMDGTEVQAGNNPPLLIDANGTRYNQTYTPSWFPTVVGGYTYSTYIPTSVEDVNGNEINYSQTAGWTDTMGRQIPLPASVSTSLCPQSPLVPVSAYTWNLPGVNGGTYPLTFCYVNVPVTQYWDNQIQHISLEELQTVLLPNSTSWTFLYTTDGNGDLSQITFPTGGTLSYTWTTESPVCAANYYDNARAVVTRTLNPNDGVSPAGTWKYGDITNVETFVTDPASNDTLHTFQTGGSDAFCSYHEGITQFYQGSHTSGTLLKTVNTSYQGVTTGPGSGAQRSLTASVWAATNQENESTFSYDNAITFHDPYWVSNTQFSPRYLQTWPGSYGLLETKKDYDYGSGAPGILLRTTTTAYEALSNSNYLNNNLLDLPASVAVTGSGPGSTTTYAYDQTAPVSSGITMQHSASPPAGTYRGNLTTTSRYLNTTGTYLNTTRTNWDTGMVDAITDPKGNPPTTYGYSSTYVGTYLTSVTNALNQTTTFTYDFNMGYLASTTDPNSQETTYSYNDKLGRLTTINYPDKGQTGYSYNDATPDPTVTTTKLATPDPTITSVTTFDGLGRARQTQITSVSPTITTYTTFDSLGRPYYVYNPTGCNPPTTNCGESTFGYSTYSYDALSRPLKITEQDGSTVTTTYSGSCSTVTDEASKTRETCTDGLERLNEVVENPGGLNYQTNYTYDVLNNLTGIVQYSSRPRGFIYDSLSRLTSSTNPESGTIAYTYDGDGNVQTRKDARGITTTYSYDALNRLKGKSYSDSTPATYFIYDTKIGWNVPQTNFIGRMTEAYTYPGGALVASIFSYDPLGRIVMNNQCDANTCPSGTGYSLTYSYDLAGNPLTEVNGYATNSYKYNGAAQPTTVTSSYVDANHPATLASNVTYLPTGQIGLMTYGNGLTGTYAANNRVQPCRYDTNSSAASLKLCTDATPSGSMLDFTYGYNWGSKDNGDVMSMSATGQQSFSRSYTYDQLDRLFTMSAPGDSCSGLSWGYDQWGNRTAQTTTGGTCSSSHLTYTAANQISNPGFTYDASGNVTHDANNSYFYDAENRIVQVNGTLPSCPTATACYVYDAFGRRDAKADVTGQFDYLYDLDGKVVAEWDIIPGYNGWGAFYVYLDGRLLVLYSNDTVYFAHSDSLGSTRLMTTLTKTKYDSMDYLPFGEQIEGDTGTTHKFTGMERDSETTSNLDNFEARYMESTLGRFMSPDPSGIWLADATDPKQLNLYNYVANNPLSNTDPSGLCTVFVGGVRDQNSGALAAAAASVGGLVVAPFGGQSTLGALLNIAAEALAGPNASSQQVSDALNSILSDPAGIQIVAFSGGAQAFSTAVESGSVGNVTSAPLSLVNTVVYLSPGLGPGGQLAFGSTAAVYHSTGVVDALATSFSRVSGQAGTALPGASGHSLQSEWNALMAGINAGTINLPAPFSPCLPIWKQPLPLIQRPPLPQLTGPGWDTLQGFPCVPLEGNPNGCSSY